MSKAKPAPATEPDEVRPPGPPDEVTEPPEAEAGGPPQPPGVTERLEALEVRLSKVESYLHKLSGQEF